MHVLLLFSAGCLVSLQKADSIVHIVKDFLKKTLQAAFKDVIATATEHTTRCVL